MPAIQPSRHCPPESSMPSIAEEVTHVYTRQHHQTGLLPSFEGPFRVAERTSRSVWKIEVGMYKDGRKRYEFRHLNDLKPAHPKSLAAPAVRPKLGRPTSSPSEASRVTDANLLQDGRQNRFPKPTAEPSPSSFPTAENKQAADRVNSSGTLPGDSHATSTLTDRVPASIVDSGLTTGPPPVSAFPARPVRSTRNQNPYYVDSIAWSATQSQLDHINNSISFRNRG